MLVPPLRQIVFSDLRNRRLRKLCPKEHVSPELIVGLQARRCLDEREWKAFGGMHDGGYTMGVPGLLKRPPCWRAPSPLNAESA